MKTLFIECNMGAAGDMLTAALLELIPDKDAFIERINKLGIPKVNVKYEPSVKCGITGTHMVVTIDGEEEESVDFHGHHQTHDHEHEHEHHHDHDHDHHHHSGMHEITHVVEDLNVSDKVKKDVLVVYQLIAEAESHAHGTPVEQVHFHEVGMMDAVADITAVCLLMEMIDPDKVVVSPINVGSGQVKTQHGILPVPAPATAYILKGVPSYSNGISGEMCTPTGAALLKHFATSFGNMPVMSIDSIGYGMGKKDFEAANCVRAILGESADNTDKVYELNCNVDDMTGEELGFAMDRLFEAGALEVFTVPVNMKKSRPGVLLRVLCSESDREKMVRVIFKHTSTIGIRMIACDRFTLDRKIVETDTPFGKIRRKESSGYGVKRYKYEHDDLAAVAKEKGISIREALRTIEEK
ncbi:MAG: nickel pincer cofactor biosynthesis protein LarC [Erysipelotrichaceae bacterium]|nr:nickel pincer cofactor biosynthesis protein LarC [Erysipelotrichaceae bacterium]